MRATDLSLLGDEHVRVYRETNGERGYLWNGSEVLLLTTRGRRSGQLRTVPLIFTAYGESRAVIASRGGAPQHPAWYLNSLDEPHVQVQVKADVYRALARTAVAQERAQIWADAVKTLAELRPLSGAHDATDSRGDPRSPMDRGRALSTRPSV